MCRGRVSLAAALLEAVAVGVHLQDVHVMGKPERVRICERKRAIKRCWLSLQEVRLCAGQLDNEFAEERIGPSKPCSRECIGVVLEIAFVDEA